MSDVIIAKIGLLEKLLPSGSIYQASIPTDGDLNSIILHAAFPRYCLSVLPGQRHSLTPFWRHIEYKLYYNGHDSWLKYIQLSWKGVSVEVPVEFT
jgi:hypothetical protein